jgi:hypothetical protein
MYYKVIKARRKRDKKLKFRKRLKGSEILFYVGDKLIGKTSSLKLSSIIDVESDKQ